MAVPRRNRTQQAAIGRQLGTSLPSRGLPAGLDAIDLRILALLTDDARFSQRALARLIRMSPTAVSERIARLEDAGVIQGYQAQVNYAALDRSLTVFVGIRSVQGEDQRRLVADLLALPVVESVDIVLGPVDLMVRLRVRDHVHLRQVFFDALLPMPGVHRTESFISLESVTSASFPSSVVNSVLEAAGPAS
jgi:DNA-binding Lrp family transcriptional regulator